jgi:O-succinylbenzoic acid--CoA ligase
MSWEGPSTEVLLNPRLPPADAERLRALIARAGALDGHVWLTTSGATGRLKPVALGKPAILASAAAVNAYLGSDARDVWLNPLPTFHVGGLGILARAHLSGAKVFSLARWDPSTYGAQLAAHTVTLTSLVPTQVFDLVRARIRPPSSLRAVVVGGGALAEGLSARARGLGWPLLPSYGATECASQVATAELGSGGARPRLRILPHAEIREDADGRLAIRSPALFTGYAGEHGLEDPKVDGWWRSADLGIVHEGWLTVRGRADDAIKVGGELVALDALQATLDLIRLDMLDPPDAALFTLPDDRLGSAVHLAVAPNDPARAAALRERFDAGVLPFERIREVHCLEELPRTALGKVDRERLLAMVRRSGPRRRDG